jgi:outer membrane lipoprotein-sorting protein
MQDKIVDYVLGILSKKESDTLAEHISSCADCEQYAQALQNENLSLLQLGETLQADMPTRQDKVIEALNRYSPTTQTKVFSIGRIIMKSRMTKLAAAAVIIIAILAGLPFINNGGPGDALAMVHAALEQARAYMYTMEMKTTGKLMPVAQESKIRAVVSDEYGMKWYVDMIDPNTGKTTSQVIYVVPGQKMVVTLMPETKQYLRMPFGDAILAKMKQQNNDPREMIKQIMKCEYTELDRTVIDGVEVQGFRTTDPDYKGALGSEATSIELTLWVDVETWLPVLMEMDINYGEQMQVTSATYDYRWNVPVQASDFEPVIPEDFKPFSSYGVKMAGMSEADAIEGLRLFAEITGRYPKNLSMMDVAQEITALTTDFENLPQLVDKLDELKKLIDQMRQNTEISEKEIRDTIMKQTIEMMRPLQSIGFFYMTLVADKTEPVYYGESVGPNDADMVLLKWKVSDDQYRAIFGDLTAEDLTADQWNELER